METVLYADVLFLINFAMDFISLSASASLGAKAKRPLRLCLAAALGAIYSVFATVSQMGAVLQYILVGAVGASMCAISFGFGGLLPFIRQYITFWGCSALLGGIMTALLSMGRLPVSGLNLPVTALSAIVVLSLTVKAIRDKAGCQFLTLDIYMGEKHLTIDALRDSGNLLRDPFTGAPVVIVSHQALVKLLPEDLITSILTCDIDTVKSFPVKLRLIPHRQNEGSGMLCALSPDRIYVSTKKRKTETRCLIAISPHHNTYFGGFCATAPSVLIP